jgi:hypothetical protein
MFFENIDFMLIIDYTTPGVNYVVRYGVVTVNVRLVLINSVKSWGPRSNLDLVHFMWNTYFIPNYATVLLPLSPSASKIAYTRHYKAEIGGGDSRTSRIFMWDVDEPRTFTDWNAKRPTSAVARFVLNRRFHWNQEIQKLCLVNRIVVNFVLTNIQRTVIKFLLLST